MSGAETALHAATRSLGAAVLAEPLGLLGRVGLLLDQNITLQTELAAALLRCAPPPRRHNRL
jgi:hypothetical protein